MTTADYLIKMTLFERASVPGAPKEPSSKPKAVSVKPKAPKAPSQENKSGGVFRVDSPDVKIDSKNLHNYSIGKGVSGVLGKGEKAPKGRMFATGLFAADRAEASTYSTPRDARRIMQGKTVWFDQRDQARISSHRSVEREYDGSSFRKLRSSGERVSRNPGEPVNVKSINNPIEHMRSQGWNVKFHSDLDSLMKSLNGRGLQVNYEGEFK